MYFFCVISLVAAKTPHRFAIGLLESIHFKCEGMKLPVSALLIHFTAIFVREMNLSRKLNCWQKKDYCINDLIYV